MQALIMTVERSAPRHAGNGVNKLLTMFELRLYQAFQFPYHIVSISLSTLIMWLLERDDTRTARYVREHHTPE